MERKIKVMTAFFGVALVLFGAGIFLTDDVTALGGRGSSVGSSSCIDSDGGNNNAVNGTVTFVGVMGNTWKYLDYCGLPAGGDSLTEYYCDGNSVVVTGTNMGTGSVLGCTNGALVPLDADFEVSTVTLQLEGPSTARFLITVENNGPHNAYLREINVMATTDEADELGGTDQTVSVNTWIMSTAHPDNTETFEVEFTVDVDWLDEMMDAVDNYDSREVYAAVSLDYSDAVAESDETNNVWTGTLTTAGDIFY